MPTTLKTTQKTHRLTLSGEIGYSETAQLWEAIQHIAQHPKDTTLEWSNLNRIHFAGVQMLIALRKTLEDHGCTLQCLEPSPDLYQQLRTFGVWHALVQP
ncbi:MAG: STAS domain-containing protein [Fimbriimonadales bacterium]|nr:STAS domain-containing protein [Fimbriimonadales bacterium]MDW8051398.1 STAS domain-containing protein [Armatimonadota bacterium]